jgi:ribosome-binding factor A
MIYNFVFLLIPSKVVTLQLMETNRQKKIGAILQMDLANVLQNLLKEAGHIGILISVTEVKVTVDLTLAKVYVSIFPSVHGEPLIEEINTHKNQIKHQVAQLVKDQLRKMPDLIFILDRSIDYSEAIDQALKGEDNPIIKPEILEKRKKS